MKKLIISSALGLLLACTKAPAQKQKFTEHISKNFQVASTQTLEIYNVSGFIKVEGYDGNKVQLEIDKTISARNQADLEKGKEEFQLDFSQSPEGLMAYIPQPYDSRPNIRHNDWETRKQIDYRYHLDYTIKVPRGMNLTLVTVNDGDIGVRNVLGKLEIRNVNGAITLEKVAGTTLARTVNGDVDINYITNPSQDSEYYTLNGDLNISYPASLSADCEYKSYNGELFTDFPEVKMLPAKVTKNENWDSGSTKYKLNSSSSFRIGNGGKRLHFETFNGNIYIKKLTES
jgi:hypothetical protein